MCRLNLVRQGRHAAWCRNAAGIATSLLLLGAAVPTAHAQYVVPAPGADECPLAGSVPLPESVIGDITGDGVADRAQGILGPTGQRGRVLVIDGATGVVIREILSPAAVQTFGLGVFPVGFGGGAGPHDLAVVSVNANDQTVVTTFALASGQQVATIVLPTAGNGTNLTPIAIGDVDGSGDVSTDDLGIAIQFYQAGTGGAAIAHADFDGDGSVSENDVWDLAARLGTTTEGVVAAEFTTALAAFISPDPGDDGPANTVGGGVLECLWCAITCGGALNQAANCVRDAPNPWDACLALHPDCTSEAFTICFENIRRTSILACLARIGAAAGECQGCVSDCGPKL